MHDRLAQPFSSTKVIHLTCTTSDHFPLWIVPSGIDPPPSSRPFRFEEMWISDKGCGWVVEVVWSSTIPCEAESQVIKKIEKCGNELTHWSRKNFGHVKRQLAGKRKWLVKAK